MADVDVSGMIKITAVGDGAVGKTSMLISFSEKEFREEYVPTVFDNYDTVHDVDDVRYNISLVDTAGQEDYDEIRQMSYEDVDVVLCCFSVDSVTSLNNVQAKWVPEIRQHCPKIPVVMVALKADLEFQVNEKRINFLMHDTGCCGRVNCSAKTMDGLNDVFDVAIKAHVQFVKGGRKPLEPDFLNKGAGGSGGGGDGGGCCSVM